MSQLTVETRGETDVVIRRHFAAPPALVWRAHTEPALLRQWLSGPDGWQMTRCDHGAEGAIRYDWQDASGAGFYLTGRFLTLEPPHRIVHIERMHLPDPTPDNRVETLFEDDGEGGTQMVMVMTVPDARIREAMLASGMAHGMEASYQRLDALPAGA